MDAPVTVFGKPDGSISYPIVLSTISFGGASQITTDSAYSNLYWNETQINSQRGFVTLASSTSNVSTSDANITATSIIMITPYGDITQGGFINNSFWVTLNSGVDWTLNLAAIADPSNPMDFAYNILQY